MGKFTALTEDKADWKAEGVMNAAGATDWFALQGRANMVISSAFTGSARLEQSFDGGTTAIPVTLDDGTVRTFAGPDRVILDEPERGVLYRLVATALTSGQIKWRFSQ